MTEFERDLEKFLEYGRYGLPDKIERQRFEAIKNNLIRKYDPKPLPVIPKFVAEWFEDNKDDLDFSIFEACINLHADYSSDFEKWFGNSENKSIETLIQMKDGYTIEEEKLFYLKNKVTRMFLMFDGEEYYEYPDGSPHCFTKQEIDSLETGSYEQIEVKDE